MRRFGTQGRVYPDKHYVVPRSEEIADFNTRVREGRYIVLFAPRQTGKTTFFRMAIDRLIAEYPSYFPIQVDFQMMRNGTPPIFYERLKQMIYRNVENALKNSKMDIPKREDIAALHFTQAHNTLLRERNINIQHLTTNVRKDPRYERILLKIMAGEEGVKFNLDDDIMSELATYGVIREDSKGMCEIVNPIYLYRILQTFKPTINGLENEYFSEEKDD